MVDCTGGPAHPTDMSDSNATSGATRVVNPNHLLKRFVGNAVDPDPDSTNDNDLL
jgi:hypothetical protein